jgi:uncharacterized protein (TIGR02271 family)
MHNRMTIDTLRDARGLPVYDANGDKIGELEDIFYDQNTNEPQWIGIGTGFFGTKRVLVPVEGATLSGDGYNVPYTKDQVKDAPDVDGDEVSEQRAAELYSHYGLTYSETRSDSGITRRDEGVAEHGLTRSEEELRVGKREVGAGRIRLHKWVETEPVERAVELRRETARVYREPVERPVASGDIGEQQVELELSAEEPVVAKQAVAKERIGLDKDVQTERETVREELRKERVEVEGEGNVIDEARR